MTHDTVDTVDTRNLPVDDLNVVVPRAAGLDVHKMCITAAVRLFEVGSGLARTAVQEFSALPDGLRAMVAWLRAHRRAQNLGARAGVAPGNNTSAGKRRSGRARKGNPTLRATLAECAHGAVRTKAPSSTAASGRTPTASVTSGQSSPRPTSCCG